MDLSIDRSAVVVRIGPSFPATIGYVVEGVRLAPGVTRATSALVPADLAFLVDGRVLFANASLWPTDPDVIRLDLNRCDPRREPLLGMFHRNLELALADHVRSDPAHHLDQLLRAAASTPEGQVSLFG